MRPFPFGTPDWRVIEAQAGPYPHPAADMDGPSIRLEHVASLKPSAHRYRAACGRVGSVADLALPAPGDSGAR